MLTTKQRTVLKSKASVIAPVFQIGKQGITDNVIKEINDALKARELIKISVLKNADFTAKEIIAELAEMTDSEPVQAIGNKIVLYRLSDKIGIKHVLED